MRRYYYVDGSGSVVDHLLDRRLVVNRLKNLGYGRGRTWSVSDSVWTNVDHIEYGGFSEKRLWDHIQEHVPKGNRVVVLVDPTGDGGEHLKAYFKRLTKATYAFEVQTFGAFLNHGIPPVNIKEADVPKVTNSDPRHRHLVEKLIGQVRLIPPSNPNVVGLFAKRCFDLAVDGQLTDEQVISIVDTWPGACQDGRDRYLKACGVERPFCATATFATLGLMVTADPTRNWYWLSAMYPSNGFDVCIIGDKVKRGRQETWKGEKDHRRHVGFFSDVTVDLTEFHALLSGTPEVVLDDDGKGYLILRTTIDYTTDGNLYVVVPI